MRLSRSDIARARYGRAMDRSARTAVTAAQILALGPAAWYRWNTGLTEAGGLLSAWADQSGNARNLAQGTGTNQPSVSGGIVSGDGLDNFMTSGAFTVNQPNSIMVLGRQDGWTSNDTLVGSGGAAAPRFVQRTATPQMGAGAASNFGNISVAIAAWAIFFAGFDNASSVIQKNAEAEVSGSVGGTNAFAAATLFSQTTGGSNFGHCSVVEVLYFTSIIDAATRAIVRTWLQQQAVLAGITIS